jgi:hypothetical protein
MAETRPYAAELRPNTAEQSSIQAAVVIAVVIAAAAATVVGKKTGTAAAGSSRQQPATGLGVLIIQKTTCNQWTH